MRIRDLNMTGALQTRQSMIELQKHTQRQIDLASQRIDELERERTGSRKLVSFLDAIIDDLSTHIDYLKAKAEAEGK